MHTVGTPAMSVIVSVITYLLYIFFPQQTFKILKVTFATSFDIIYISLLLERWTFVKIIHLNNKHIDRLIMSRGCRKKSRVKLILEHYLGLTTQNFENYCRLFPSPTGNRKSILNFDLEYFFWCLF